MSSLRRTLGRRMVPIVTPRATPRATAPKDSTQLAPLVGPCSRCDRSADLFTVELGGAHFCKACAFDTADNIQRVFEPVPYTSTDEDALDVHLVWDPACEKRQGCGGECVLAKGHTVPCECAGDTPGAPGTCPA